jgi:MFS family permease
MFKLPRAVWLLGWVSLATDSASEAIYPLLPYFLTRTLGAGAVALGVVEGAAEAANSILKIVSGLLADWSPTKRPLVLFGYSVSSIARPFIAVTTSWTQVFAVRVCDRVGKGVRGAPRDAMLAAWATPETRGRVFGFHRAMDHTGAIVGPAAAALFLFLMPGEYRTLFALTAIPGAIAVALIFLVPEAQSMAGPAAEKAGVAAPSQPERSEAVVSAVTRSSTPGRPEVAANIRVRELAADSRLSRRFYVFMGVLALFTLGNSSDAFLLLRLTDAAGSARYVPFMWAGLHVVKASVSVAGGHWSDRIGRRTVIALGWVVYAAVYLGFAASSSLPALLAWFLVYGFYFGFAEGTEKALVADLAPEASRGLAFGIYNAVLGLGAFAASVLFGIIWKTFGAAVAFGAGSALALAATALLALL